MSEVKIVISGVEGINKGAELMLYAILSEIEQKFPSAIIYLPISQFPNGLGCIKTTLKLRQSPNKFVRFLGKYHLTGILNRLGLKSKYLNNLYPVEGAKYYLDASGLHFSDQMISSNRIAKDLQILLQGYKMQGTKIIYLPQAFGPFYKNPSRNAVEVALNYSDLVIARDDTSLYYLQEIKGFRSNVKKYYDFTGVLHPCCPIKYRTLAGKVCIIPNKQLIRKGIMSREKYIELMLNIINSIYDEGYEAFFLDHADDLDLIKQCVEQLPFDIPIVKDENALTVKAIIGQSYLCISSRFHGVVSSFTMGVPCLTTSWNHKYQELLQLYDMTDSLLQSTTNECKEKVKLFLSEASNKSIRSSLREKNELVNLNIKEMWELVWSIK